MWDIKLEGGDANSSHQIFHLNHVGYKAVDMAGFVISGLLFHLNHVGYKGVSSLPKFNI